MNERECISNIESLCAYLLERMDEKEEDEHWYPILNAQTKENKDENYKDIVVQLFKWASKYILEVK